MYRRNSPAQLQATVAANVGPHLDKKTADFPRHAWREVSALLGTNIDFSATRRVREEKMLLSLLVRLVTSPAFAGEQSTGCATAVVGGGWAGVYAAWRLVVDAKSVPAAELCVFEARSAVGGRTYSVSVETGGTSLVIDVGAYRFGSGQHLPGDLILNRLNISVACYQPDCAPDLELHQTLYKVVDAEGRNAGYATPIRAMLAELIAAGTRVFYEYELTGVYRTGTHASAGARLSLHFAGGAVVSASAVLLNLPRAALHRLDPASAVFPPSNTSLAYSVLRSCNPCNDGRHAPPERIGLKVYAVYDDPWWASRLNLTEGNFKATEDGLPPLVGRYHDGPVLRGRAYGAEGAFGPGALEAVYTYTVATPQVAWYLPFAPGRADEPLVVTTDPALLAPLHARLMGYHAGAFAARGLNASDVPPMSKAVLGVWTSDPLAALPNPMSSRFDAMPLPFAPGVCPAEPCLAGVTPQQYVAAVETPNADGAAARIHIANNDFAWTGFQGLPCCWAPRRAESAPPRSRPTRPSAAPEARPSCPGYPLGPREAPALLAGRRLRAGFCPKVAYLTAFCPPGRAVAKECREDAARPLGRRAARVARRRVLHKAARGVALSASYKVL